MRHSAAIARCRRAQDRIFLNDLIYRHAICKQIKHKVDSNAHAADTCSSAHDIWIECDSVKRSIYGLHIRTPELA